MGKEHFYSSNSLILANAYFFFFFLVVANAYIQSPVFVTKVGMTMSTMSTMSIMSRGVQKNRIRLDHWFRNRLEPVVLEGTGPVPSSMGGFIHPPTWIRPINF